MKIIPEIQVPLTEIEIKALVHCVRMAMNMCKAVDFSRMKIKELEETK